MAFRGELIGRKRLNLIFPTLLCRSLNSKNLGRSPPASLPILSRRVLIKVPSGKICKFQTLFSIREPLRGRLLCRFSP